MGDDCRYHASFRSSDGWEKDVAERKLKEFSQKKVKKRAKS